MPWAIYEWMSGAPYSDDGVDDELNRACGYALHQAALIIPYYTETNPRSVAMAARTVGEILSDWIP